MHTKNTIPEIISIKGKKKAKIGLIKKPIKRSSIVIQEIFTPSCVGHVTKLVNLGAGASTFVVQDFLVDSSGLSGGGESVNPIIQVGLNASKKIIFTLAPEACKKFFKVSKPSGISNGYLSFTFGRSALSWASGGSGYFDIYPATVIFNNLSGTAPVITYSNFFISNGTNNAFYVFIEGEFSKNFTFTDIQIECTYPRRNFLPEFGSYKLLSYSQPFTIPLTTDICYALFGYNSPTQTDLGQIIDIL